MKERLFRAAFRALEKAAEWRFGARCSVVVSCEQPADAGCSGYARVYKARGPSSYKDGGTATSRFLRDCARLAELKQEQPAA